MASNATFLLLTALVLSQCVPYTAPTPQHDYKVIEELNDITRFFTPFEDEKPSLHVQLKIAIMHECGPLFNFTMQQGKKVVQKMLKDSEVLAHASDQLEAQLAEFSEFVVLVEQAETHAEQVKFFDVVGMANRYDTLVGKYDTPSPKQPGAVELLIWAALERNGLSKLKADFYRLFMETVPKFNAKIDAYLDLLSADQRKKEKKLSEWYESYKTEPDIEQKRQIFSSFFFNI